MPEQLVPSGPHYYPNRFEVPTAGVKDGRNYATSDDAVQVPHDGKSVTYAKEKVSGLHAKQRPPKVRI